MERARAAELARASQEASEGAGQDRAGRQEQQGAALARRALEQARSNLLGPSVNARPEPDQRRRAGILGADPRNIQLAFYGEGWRQKVERIGSLNYPRVSKDRFYEPLVVTVSINSDGTLASIRIDKSSGQRDMDEAVRRIVEMSAPFSAFPPDLKRNYDVIDITRTWIFDERPRMTSR
jgi:protein TonB